MNGRASKEDILLWSKLGALLANYKASESFYFNSTEANFFILFSLRIVRDEELFPAM